MVSSCQAGLAVPRDSDMLSGHADHTSEDCAKRPCQAWSRQNPTMSGPQGDDQAGVTTDNRSIVTG